jgi:peptide/nickel transport system permease protein
MLVVLVLTSLVVFAILRLIPGNPAVILAGPDATPETVQAITAELGLDRPLPDQYRLWVTGLVTGQLGRSYIYGRPISQLIASHLVITLQLTLAATVFAGVVGFALGLLSSSAAWRRVRVLASGLTSVGYAVPPYVSGILLVLVFAITLPVLPATGYVSPIADSVNGFKSFILPAACLGLPEAAVVARFLAASVLRSLNEEYIETATAKGLSWPRIVFRHAVPNALPPVIAISMIQIGQMLGGAVVVEAIFAWPGLGQLIIQSFQNHDYLVVQDLILIAVVTFTVLQTVGDVLHTLTDPRVRLEVQ